MAIEACRGTIWPVARDLVERVAATVLDASCVGTFLSYAGSQLFVSLCGLENVRDGELIRAQRTFSVWRWER